MATYTHILHGSTTYVADINTFMDTLSADMTRVENGVLVAANPIWRDIPVQNWTVGQVVSFSLLPYVISDSAVTIAYVSGALPDGLTLVSGVITGTISALQGGSYEYVVSATNDSQVPIIKVLPIFLVSLEVTAPIWKTTPNNLPDVTYKQDVTIVPINLPLYLLTDGDPINVIPVTYTIDETLTTLPTGISLAGDVISGAIDASAAIETRTIDVVATTNTGSTTESFDFQVTTADVGAIEPFIASWESGELGCSVGAVPTWNGGGYFAVEETQTGVTIDLNAFIADAGGVLSNWVSSSALPDFLILNPTTGIIFGNIADAVGIYTTTFTVDNPTGTSEISPVFTFNVWSAAVTAPTLVGIEAIAGSHEVTYSFSDAVEAVPPLDFISGNLFSVNDSLRNLTYSSGDGTSQIKFIADGVAFSGGNTLMAVITNPNIQSVANGLVVVDTGVAGVSFIVPTPGNSWSISQNYEAEALGTIPNGWGSTQSTITNENAYLSNKCVKNIVTLGATFGVYGGIIKFPSVTRQYGTLNIKFRTFYPVGWNFNPEGRNKFIRVKSETGSGNHIGYIDIYINSWNTSRPFEFIYEGRQDLGWTTIGTLGDEIKLGVWETYEAEIILDTISVDDGGAARVKFWKDGRLIADLTNAVTMKADNNINPSLYMYTFWDNAGSTYDQHSYLDDLSIITSIP